MDELEKLRHHLDLCDEIIIDALLMRNKIIEEITMYKTEHDVKMVQPQLEEQKRKRLAKRLEGKEYPELVKDVYDSILFNSKKIKSNTLFDNNIVLIGFMGCGKSTISKALRRFFSMDVIEMDEVIAEQEGMSIPEIFEIHGEQYFRDAETQLLKDLQNQKNVVISCGGGTAMREVNVVEMKKNGKVVLLTAKPETVLERVKNSHDRPLLENNKNVDFIAELMNKRRAKYEAAADIIIETDGKSSLEICEEIIARVQGK